MKIIDLLNKIANGEEVPKKIAIQNQVLIYNEDTILTLQDCYLIADEEDATWKIWAYKLNDDVEILEEKKIPEKLSILQFSDLIDMPKEELVDVIKEQRFKINEIIDYLDYLKSKGE